jgi:hypothetical protein
LTDTSSFATAPSAPVTPFDDALGISTGGSTAAAAGRPAPEGYLSAKEPAASQLPQQKASPGKRDSRRGRRRGRSKDKARNSDKDGKDGKDGKDKEARSSRYASSARSWLPTRASPRPRSQPPPAEANRLSVAGMGGFVKGLREVMSRDSKGAAAAVVSVAAVDGESAAVDGTDGTDAVGNGADEAAGAVEGVAVNGGGLQKSGRSMGLGRRKSGKKGKSKKEGSPGRMEVVGPERQCVTM